MSAYTVLDLDFRLELRIRTNETDRLVADVVSGPSGWRLFQAPDTRFNVVQRVWDNKPDAYEALVALGERHVGGAS